MTRAERSHLLGLAPHDLGILAAQRGDGRRLNRFRERAGFVLPALYLLDLIETGLRFGGMRARRAELIAQLGELLLGDELPFEATRLLRAL